MPGFWKKAWILSDSDKTGTPSTTFTFFLFLVTFLGESVIFSAGILNIFSPTLPENLVNNCLKLKNNIFTDFLI